MLFYIYKVGKIQALREVLTEQDEEELKVKMRFIAVSDLLNN